MTEQSDKAEESVKKKPRESPEYRRFKKLLKRVVNAPPVPKEHRHPE